MNDERESSYKNKSTSNNEITVDNKIKIGCFGDSYTYGDEVNYYHDYPSQLQNIFKDNGMLNYEVINYGMNWHGFHQSYMIWEAFNNEHSLDFVVFGPMGFWITRDSKFNHTFESNYVNGLPEYIHARYVLNEREDDVKLIEIDGESLEDKINNYWSFIPSYNLIRYDFEIPVFLRTPIALLKPQKKILKNPFYYYTGDINDEMDKIYKILLNRISSQSKKVILTNYNQRVVNLGKSLVNENMISASLYQPHNFPYIAIGKHNSPLGNMILAEQIYYLISGVYSFELDLLSLKNEMILNNQSSKIISQSLDEIDDISIDINKQNIGRFYILDIPFSKYCAGRECKSEINVFENVKSLIGFLNNNFVESVFVPLGFELKNGMNLLFISKYKNGNTKNINMGKVNLISKDANIGVIDVGNIEIIENLNLFSDGLNNKKSLISFPEFISNIDSIDYLGEHYISIDNRVILDGTYNKTSLSLEFYPSQKGLFVIRPDGNYVLDVRNLKQEEIINLKLSKGSETEHIPIGIIKKINKHISLDIN